MPTMSYPPAPPLLLTRRISSFLHASLSSLQQNQDQQLAMLQTALLVTPSGKLLAYESPLPVRTLRTHCSVAASLWAIHASSSPSVAVALGQAAPNTSLERKSASSPSLAPASATTSPLVGRTGAGPDFGSPTGEDEPQQPYHDGSAPVSVAASFNGGAVFVVRRLRCGLLFACSTQPPNKTSRPSTATGPSAAAAAIITSAPTSVSGSAAPFVAAPAAPPGVTQSSLLPQSTLPISPPPAERSIPFRTTSSSAAPSTAGAATATSPSAATSPSSMALPAGAPTPTPITVPPKPAPTGSSDDMTASSSVPLASIRTSPTVEAYETAPSGNEHGQKRGPVASTYAERDDDAASTTTTATATTAGGGSGKGGSVAATLAIVRRQVDQLAMLLDDKLGALAVPEENIGINGFC